MIVIVNKGKNDLNTCKVAEICASVKKCNFLEDDVE